MPSLRDGGRQSRNERRLILHSFRLSICFASLALVGAAHAQATLPYSVRTLSLSGMSTTVSGDIRTVGMGGASAGLADTFIAAVSEPAGLAMTAGVGDIHFTSNQFQDGHVQSINDPQTIRSFGLALGLYPWAVSAGFLTPYSESGKYQLPTTLVYGLSPVHLSVVTRELVFSAARVFFHNRLSIGASVVLGQAERSISAPKSLGGHDSFESYTAGATLGAMVQLPKRVLLGVSFSSPLRYSAASEATQQKLAVPGFFQPVEVPWRVSLGLGFVPNRFFRADFTLNVLTTDKNAALIRDETALVGQHVTVQPHLGIAYVFADHKEFKATLFLGAYFESTRIAGTTDRMHGTGGVEARIWIITFGGGVDLASQYKSFLFSVGVDVFGLMARLGVIPRFGTPASDKLLPKPWVFRDEGLARPLMTRFNPAGSLDPIAVTLAIPKKLVVGARTAIVDLKQIGHDIAETVETPAQREKKAAAARQAEEAARALLVEQAWEAEAAQAAENTRLGEEKKRAAALARARRRAAKKRALLRSQHSQ